jgi:hypothetical protein
MQLRRTRCAGAFDTGIDIGNGATRQRSRQQPDGEGRAERGSPTRYPLHRAIRMVVDLWSERSNKKSVISSQTSTGFRGAFLNFDSARFRYRLAVMRL